jgi:hypothetical protein
MAKASILSELIHELRLTTSAFERNIGVSNSAIKSAIKRDSDISVGILTKVLDKYPQVNKNWLLTGEGQMFNNYPQSGDNNKLGSIFSASKNLPMSDEMKTMLHTNKMLAESNKQLAESVREMVGIIKTLTTPDYAKKALVVA